MEKTGKGIGWLVAKVKKIPFKKAGKAIAGKSKQYKDSFVKGFREGNKEKGVK